MPDSELMPIGVFARRSGLTSSALRFYADSGLLSPAEVDPVSGYRFYSAEQVARATMLRQLREIAMPLAAVEALLDSGADDASRLLDEHVSKIVGDAAAAQQKAAAIKATLGNMPGLPITVLKGPVLADAVEQILTATAHEPGMPVLTGLRIEASHEAVTLTATDRYRLSTRTLVPADPPRQTWAGTVDGDELRAAVAEIRRSALVRLEAVPHGIWLRVADPAQALAWDIRALDAADAVTEQRVQEHHASLHIAGFYPSLHLNLADNYRRLGSFEAATEHINAAKAHALNLPQDPYGDLLRGAIQEVAEAIAGRDRIRRPSAPGSPA